MNGGEQLYRIYELYYLLKNTAVFEVPNHNNMSCLLRCMSSLFVLYSSRYMVNHCGLLGGCGDESKYLIILGNRGLEVSVVRARGLGLCLG